MLLYTSISMINEDDTSHTQCPASPNWCQSMQQLWHQKQLKQNVPGSYDCTEFFMILIKMSELFDTVWFLLYWTACISVGTKFLKPFMPVALKVFSESSATQWNDEYLNDLQEYLTLKKHKVS